MMTIDQNHPPADGKRWIRIHNGWARVETIIVKDGNKNQLWSWITQNWTIPPYVFWLFVAIAVRDFVQDIHAHPLRATTFTVMGMVLFGFVIPQFAWMVKHLYHKFAHKEQV